VAAGRGAGLTDAIKRCDFVAAVWLFVIRAQRAKNRMMKPGRATSGFDQRNGPNADDPRRHELV
jgi:hypothetical protein